MTPFIVICCYLGLLLALGIISTRLFRGTAKDYFVASHSIGPFMLLMSVFGTTMTAFALVGSTGKAYQRGIGVYGLMASWSGLIHAAVFFLIGIKLWAFGKKYGYVTQIQFFRARFESNGIGFLLFPIIVGLVIPYLLIGVMGAGYAIMPVTKGAFPELFPHPKFAGGIPPWITGLAVCGVVLTYVFLGGSRSAAWANTFQTLVFMGMGLVAFYLISDKLGGLEAAIKQANADHLVRTPTEIEIKTKGGSFMREVGMHPLTFFTYMFIPLSVGMFPHLFQHWLTAKSAKSFRLTVIAHPICIAIVWVPCVLIGIWATGAAAGIPPLDDGSVGKVLGITVGKLIKSPIISGLLSAGILAAIMSSLDSQFLCMGTIFTNDVVIHKYGRERFTDKQIIWLARGFIILIVAITYALAMLAIQNKANIFDLAVWCFTGFGSLFPLVFAAVYWKRVTKAGAYASVAVTAIVWFLFFRASGYGGEYTVYHVMPAAYIFGASAITLVVVSLLTKPPSEETIAKFFPEKKLANDVNGS